jgi:hypothetical protein
MRGALNIFDTVASIFTIKRDPVAIEDPTFYQIKTSQHEYAGKILFQDNMIIKLKVDEMKVVKILKENILKITIRKETNVEFN